MRVPASPASGTSSQPDAACPRGTDRLPTVRTSWAAAMPGTRFRANTARAVRRGMTTSSDDSGRQHAAGFRAVRPLVAGPLGADPVRAPTPERQGEDGAEGQVFRPAVRRHADGDAP